MIKQIFYCDRCGIEYKEPYVKKCGVNIRYIENDMDKQYGWEKDLCPVCAKTLADSIKGYFKLPETPVILQGAEDNPNLIVIATESGSGEIRFTIDGTDPRSNSSFTYTEPFEISSDVVVKAVVLSDRVYGEVAEKECTFVPEISAPIVSCENNLVSITSEDNTETYYTTDGSEPTEEGILYEGIFSIDHTITVKAVSYKDGKRSAITEHECVFDY